MIINSAELLKDAGKNGYAVPAFNIDNMESAIAVTNIVKKHKLPVIIQTIPRTLAYGGTATYAAMVSALLGDSTAVLHLDHGTLDTVKECIACGYRSVMFDGSSLPFEENVKATLEARELADGGVSLEGELGCIGGKEQGDRDIEIEYTRVDEAIEFAERTLVDSLAIGVGSQHGIYKKEPKINVERIAEIHAAIATPLVLHGASGIPNSIVRECILAGITKINFATELRQAFTRGVKLGMSEHPEAFDPKVYLPYAIAEIEEVAFGKLRLCYGL